MVGVLFTTVGLLGFIPGFTTNYEQMQVAGTHSGAMLLSFFAVSVLHNIVHVLFGVAGLFFGRTWSGARGYLVGGGVTYVLLWMYGLLLDHRGDGNVVPLNSADSWVHLTLGVGMITLGVLLSAERRSGDPLVVKLRLPGPRTHVGRQLSVPNTEVNRT